MTVEQQLQRGRPSTRMALEGADIARLAVGAPIARSTSTVEEVRASLVGHRHESCSHVLVVDGPRFIGLVRDIDLMAASGDTAIVRVAMEDPPIATLGTTRDAAAWAAISRGESEVVVLDDDGSPLGVIPASTLLAVLFREHSDDLAHLAGYAHQGASARAATEENVGLRLRHRLPWLLIGLGGALAAAQLVAQFEHALEREVALAFFIPGIVYIADAVGTQTETVVIRGMSLGIDIRSIVAREVATGLIVGLVMSVLFLPAALVMLGSAELAIAVSCALASACSLASVVALGVPWLIQRTGRDPAFGSGPLATVIQDLLSIATYFAIVSQFTAT